MQLAWKTPPAQRTEGQRLNVTQIEGTLAINSLRKLVTEKDVVALMPADVQAQHAALKAQIDTLDKQKPTPHGVRPRDRRARRARRRRRTSCIAAARTRAER